MPYITTEEVKKIRTLLKTELKEFKISVTQRHHSTIVITLVEGPLDFGITYEQVNPYYLEKNWAQKPECLKVLLQIKNNVEREKPIEGHDDSDYGFVPNYYMDINIGTHEKPYVIKSIGDIK
jgi:hypothetical protein